MPKEISCEIIKEYFSVNEQDDSEIKICEVKWNGRSPKGYDIRKYDKNEEKLFKGITIPYDDYKDLIYKSIENGLVDLEEVKKRISKRESQIINDSDFNEIFKSVEKSSREYERDKYGILHDADNKNLVIIPKRRMSKK